MATMAATWKIFNSAIFLVIFVFFNIFSLISARKHSLKLVSDVRDPIHLANFGFLENGYMFVKITDLKEPPKNVDKTPIRYGFSLDKSLGSNSLFLSAGKKACLFANFNATAQTVPVVLFTIDFKKKVVKIDRYGQDFWNLTITNTAPSNDTSDQRQRRNAQQKLYTVVNRQKRESAVGNKSSITKPSVNSSFSDATSGIKMSTDSHVTVLKDEISVNELELKETGKTEDGGVTLYSTQFNVKIKNSWEVGLYTLAFHNCIKNVSMVVAITESNNGNFLSVGDMPLPIMYFVLSVTYVAVGSLWFYILCTSQEGVFKIHYLMLTLMYIKGISLLFHGVNYHFIQD